MLRFYALLGMDVSREEQRFPAASGSLSTSVTALLSLGVRKVPLFLGWEEQRAQQQDSSGLPCFGSKIKLSEKAVSCSSHPLTTLPTATPSTGCVSDLWSQNPCCALRSRGNGMDQCLPQGSPNCSLIPQITHRRPFTCPHLG